MKDDMDPEIREAVAKMLEAGNLLAGPCNNTTDLELNALLFDTIVWLRDRADALCPPREEWPDNVVPLSGYWKRMH